MTKKQEYHIQLLESLVLILYTKYKIPSDLLGSIPDEELNLLQELIGEA
jgi:hypothetical protein